MKKLSPSFWIIRTIDIGAWIFVYLFLKQAFLRKEFLGRRLFSGKIHPNYIILFLIVLELLLIVTDLLDEKKEKIKNDKDTALLHGTP